MLKSLRMLSRSSGMGGIGPGSGGEEDVALLELAQFEKIIKPNNIHHP
jgi:hypothetical protein